LAFNAILSPVMRLHELAIPAAEQVCDDWHFWKHALTLISNSRELLPCVVAANAAVKQSLVQSPFASRRAFPTARPAAQDLSNEH